MAKAYHRRKCMLFDFILASRGVGLPRPPMDGTRSNRGVGLPRPVQMAQRHTWARQARAPTAITSSSITRSSGYRYQVRRGSFRGVAAKGRGGVELVVGVDPDIPWFFISPQATQEILEYPGNRHPSFPRCELPALNRCFQPRDRSNFFYFLDMRVKIGYAHIWLCLWLVADGGKNGRKEYSSR